MVRLPSLLLFCLLFSPNLRAAEKIDFNRDILPILSDNCFQCHGFDEKSRKAKLRLDTFEGATGKMGGPVAIVPGKSSESELFKRIVSQEADEIMPPKKSNRTLTEKQKQLLKAWIDSGAQYAPHWAFVKPVPPKEPQVASEKFIRNPIDRFIQAELEKLKLSPSPEADKARLLRRVTLDLTGLPPTPEELDAFLKDNSADAYEKVVDRLLKSPRFGERMVWEWLEAARYADTNGFQGDPTRPMHYWRDWVIKAFNENKRFDEFTLEQLAGDLLPKPSIEQLIATGFNRNHMINGEGGRIAEESRVDYVFDRVETTGTIWLGLTLNCCRCHDHKFDPLSQKEYYQLAAYFNSVDESGANDAGGLAHPILTFPTEEQAKRIAEAQEAVRKAQTERDNAAKLVESTLPKAGNEKIDEKIKNAEVYLNNLKLLKQSEDKLAAAKKTLQDAERSQNRTMVMRDRKDPRPTHILDKGAYDKPKEKVEHGTPAVLPPLPKDAPKNRLALAQWIISPENPLTARVTVNRFWQQFFGVGLVKTPDDFGLQGERPSHPELLDWLAVEFQKTGWDVKRLIRLMVTSHTYRQSTKVTPEQIEKDPENRYYARGPRYRLPSFVIRDQALFVSGLLVEKMGGPAVKGYQPEGVWEEATFGQIRYTQDKGEALYRRSVYQFWRRIVGPTVFFDVAARQNCTVRTNRTNTPLHALVTLNDVTYIEAARNLAQRTLLSNKQTDEQKIDEIFLRCVSRTATKEETDRLVKRLADLRKRYAEKPEDAKKLISVGESKADPKLAPAELASWTAICNVILNLDETLSKE